MAILIIKPSALCDYKVVIEPMLDFGSAGKIQLGKIETEAKAVSLFDLIETKVDPASFTITLGEPRTLRYIVKSLETDSSSDEDEGSLSQFDSSIDGILYLLDKSYSLNIEKIEWTNAPAISSQPTKDSIEGNPYDFHANAAGKIKGLAKGYLKVEELKSTKTAEFTADANWSCFVNSEPVQILVNGKPLGSENYHMGQKIVLSYKAEPDDLENVIWSIENPLAYKSNINTRIATHTVKNYEVATLTPEDLKKKQVEFYLYDFDPERVVKNGSFTYQISGEKYVKAFEIPYSRPYLDRPPFILPLKQKIDVAWDKIIEKWRLGFVDRSQPGIYAMGKFVNNTEVNYIVGTYQLVKVNGVRTFIKSASDNIATNPSLLGQFLKTIDGTAHPATNADFWLDTHSPQDDMAQTAIVIPASNTAIELANDIPSVALDELATFSGSLYYSGGCAINEEFFLFVFAKPTEITNIQTEDPEYYNSVWFPIAIYKWNWSGEATYSLEKGWKLKPEPANNNIGNLTETNIASFSSWPDVTKADINPVWREL